MKDTLSFKITNTGNANLEVNNIVSSNATVFIGLTPTAFTLIPSASQTLDVEFSPLTGTSYSAALTINSNTNDAVVTVEGNGAELTVGVNPGSLNPTVHQGNAVNITITPSAPILWQNYFSKPAGQFFMILSQCCQPEVAMGRR